MFYRLDRFSNIHRLLRTVSYSVLWHLPDAVKWPLIGVLLKGRLPYRLLQAGDVAVQIGSPWDLLKAGRSRAIHLARRVGDSGRVVVIEPDSDNVKALKSFIERRKIRNMMVVQSGAWSTKAQLRFLVDPKNPAANVVEEVWDNSRVDHDRFEVTQIDVDSVDNILRDLNLPVPRLVSITTNGSENEILKGMTRIAGELSYIATISRDSEIHMLKDLGYEILGEDDRGWTYQRSK